ncbi:VTT domain-containing protein [Advenella mimigardefordensis]|uniref:Protein DedA n=1 Tax=Advenella mimigardefordensis (strain DSM 17166 / LMG 22922 / DPN7) TaxID=1247726 RepID=W0PHZ4_ADVMD|nr:VTT domain-containing protein [Advenella mimigardefordensis]AHG65070.1 protein DedA [Advenella mimigardefordensis DPN7]
MNFSSLFGWLHDNQALMAMLHDHWSWGICLVALILFLETGLVVLPFLPGDSLLFAVGAFMGISGIPPFWYMVMLFAAAVVGDYVNYSIGRSPLGQTLVRKGWVKQNHIEKTHAYFEKYGGSTITLARFIPIVRTIAPFLAGLSGMDRRHFALYNVLGGFLWIFLLVMAGYFLGRITWVQENLSLFTLGIVIISVLPMAWHVFKLWKESRQEKPAGK